MARLKRDNSSWKAQGLYQKYKQPNINDTPRNTSRSKKDTRKWCKGKVGREHKLERYFWRYGWESKRTNWIRSRCTECRKEFYNKDSSIPLRIELDERDGIRYPIQVKVNGKAIPFDRNTLEHISSHYNSWWCVQCREWHR